MTDREAQRLFLTLLAIAAVVLGATIWRLST